MTLAEATKLVASATNGKDAETMTYSDFRRTISVCPSLARFLLGIRSALLHILHHSV